jgi:hypothetical protein
MQGLEFLPRSFLKACGGVLLRWLIGLTYSFEICQVKVLTVSKCGYNLAYEFAELCFDEGAD